MFLFASTRVVVNGDADVDLYAAVSANNALSVSAGLGTPEIGTINGDIRTNLQVAAGNICLEATARGLSVHQMAGIVPDVIRETYQVPEDFVPVTAIAIGYSADPESLLTIYIPVVK